MAQLKDLIVNGVSRLIGDVITDNIQITTLKAPNSSNSTTYSAGGQGQALFSNGNSIYWDVIPQTVTDAMVGSWGYGKITSVSGANGLTGNFTITPTAYHCISNSLRNNIPINRVSI